MRGLGGYLSGSGWGQVGSCDSGYKTFNSINYGEFVD